MTEDTVQRLRTAYRQLKKQNNITFVPVGILCVLYLLLRQDWLMYGACLALVLALAVNKKRANAYERVFLDESARFSGELAVWVQEAVPGAEAVGCGYVLRDDGFYNVLWIVGQDTLYLFDMPVQSHFVYSVENTFHFIFSMGEQTAPIEKCAVSTIRFQPVKENHQDFLREQAMDSQELLVMQSFLYNRVCAQAMAGKLNGAIRMNDSIGHLRKETLYASQLPGETVLYATEDCAQQIE